VAQEHFELVASVRKNSNRDQKHAVIGNSVTPRKPLGAAYDRVRWRA
jgi:hypothetical protein